MTIISAFPHQNATCQKCSLYEKSYSNDGSRYANCVPGEGPRPADIMLVGEALGNDEVCARRPFVGVSGRFLDQCLIEAGTRRQDVFITNSLRCHPEANKLPTAKRQLDGFLDACSEYLHAEIAEVRPKVIVALGAVPFDALRTAEQRKEEGRGGISKAGVQGVPRWSEQFNCWIIPTYHPSFVTNRRLDKKPDLVEALREAVSIASGVPVEKKSSQGIPEGFVIAKTKEEIDKIFAEASSAKYLTIDTETTSLDFWKATILCVSVGWGPKKGGVIPIYLHENAPFWDEPDLQSYALNIVSKILALPTPKGLQNGKFDLLVFYDFGQRIGVSFKIVNYAFDSLVAHYLNDENKIGQHGLEVIAHEHTDYGGYDLPLEEEKDRVAKATKVPKKEVTYDMLDTEILYPYACYDTDVVWCATEPMHNQLVADGCDWVMYNLCLPLVKALAQVEYYGIRLDVEYALSLEKEYLQIIDDLYTKFLNTPGVAEIEAEKKAEFVEEVTQRWLASPSLQKKYTTVESYVDYWMAKESVQERISFNPRSPKDLPNLLFNKLGVPILSTTPGGAPSTDADTLFPLVDKYPVIETLIQIRSYEGFLAKYIQGALNNADSRGYVHTDYKVHGTVTGRLSSSNPNLHNQPKRHKYIDTAKIRRMYVADEGCELFELDYKQAEVRWWCQLSRDKKLLEFLSDPQIDIHKLVASQAFGVPVDQVTKMQRQVAKDILFGLMYGRGAESIVEEMQHNGVTEFTIADGERIKSTIFKMFPIAKRWIDQTHAFVQQVGYVTNYFGRRRRLPNAWSSNKETKGDALRQSVNAPIQSSSSDMLSLKTIGIVELLKKFKHLDPRIRVVLSIHDALFINCPPEHASQVLSAVVDFMQEPIQEVPGVFKTVRVPMPVEMKRGRTWGDMVEVELSNIIGEAA